MWTNSYFLTENNKEIDFSNKTVFVAMTNFLRMCKQDSVCSDPSESCSILKYFIERWWSCNHCNNSKTVHNLKKPWIEIHVKWSNDKKLRSTRARVFMWSLICANKSEVSKLDKYIHMVSCRSPYVPAKKSKH